MSAPRFFCDVLCRRRHIALPEALAHHAIRVLRLRAGRPWCCSAAGRGYPAVLEIDGKAGFDQARRWWIRAKPSWSAASRWYRACPAGDKMDWVVEKAVELERRPGAHRRAAQRAAIVRPAAGKTGGALAAHRPISRP